MKASALSSVCAVAALFVAGSASAIDFVKDGRLNVRFEGVDVPETAFARSEFLRITDAVTGCGTNAAAGAGAIALSVDPSLGSGDTFRIEAKGGRMTIAGSNPKSVGFGIFETLERLGCRWFWAGPDGEYLPAPAKTLSLADFSCRSTAAIPNRTFSFHLTRSQDAQWKKAFFDRQRMHPRKGYGGHLFNWVRPADCKTPKEYFEKHPEQHALWKGKRVSSQHCYTSPETFKTFVDFYVRSWDEHPEAEYMSLSPKDAPVYCTCEECAKKGDSSTLYFDFINRLVTELEKIRPGKKYRTIAYSFYVKVPKVKLHPAITFEYCMYNRCYMHPFGEKDCPINPKALREMAAWQEVLGSTPGIYGYHFDLWSSPKPMLAPMERVFQDEIKWARDRKMGYWYTEWYGGWAYQKKANKRDRTPPVTIREDCRPYCHRFPAYALCRFLWDPDQDLDALKRDWCSRVYGPAADEMFAYLTALEDAWGVDDHIGGYNGSPDRHADKFITKELMAKADAAFAAAEKKLANSSDARAKGEVALEKVWWLRWRDLKTSRDNWETVGKNPDPDRIAYLLDEAQPGLSLYPWEENPADNWTDWVPGKLTDAQKRQKSDGLLWGNHYRNFRGGPWVNYECSMDVRFAPEETRKELTLRLRSGGPRFGEPFGYLSVNLTDSGYSAQIYMKHGEPTKPLVPRTKRANLLGDRPHHLVARVVDTKLRVTLDGEVLYTVDVPIGGGTINLWSRAQTMEVTNVSVRRIEVPTQDELAGYKARKAGKKAKIDGTGRVIYE